MKSKKLLHMSVIESVALNQKVSVIIPTYNRKEYLAEAIDSVLAQSLRDFEVIVVDDGSSDKTGEFIQERYGDKVRYFYKENGGCATARNFGLKEARGRYIAFLDSDDRYLPDKLADQAGILDSHPDIGFVYSDSYTFGDGGQVRNYAVRPDKEGSIVIPLFLTTFLSNGSFLVRRSCLDAVGYYDEQLRYNEDTDFFLRIAMHCKVFHSPRVTFAYRVHGGRKSANTTRLLDALYKSSANFLQLHPEVAERLGKKGGERLAQIKLDLAMEYVGQNDLASGLREVEIAHGLAPGIRTGFYRFLFRNGYISTPLLYRGVSFCEALLKSLQAYSYRYLGWL